MSDEQNDGQPQFPDAYALQQQRNAVDAAAQEQVADAARQQEAAAEMAAMQKEAADAVAALQSLPGGGGAGAATDSDPAPEEHKGGSHSHAQSQDQTAPPDNSQSSQPPPSPLDQAQGKVGTAQNEVNDLPAEIVGHDVKTMTPDDFRDQLENQVGKMVEDATQTSKMQQALAGPAANIVQLGNAFLEQIQKPGLTDADLAKSLQQFQDGLKDKVGDDSKIKEASNGVAGSSYQNVKPWQDAVNARVNLDQQTALAAGSPSPAAPQTTTAPAPPPVRSPSGMLW